MGGPLLFSGFDDAVNAGFGIKSHRHREAFHTVAGTLPPAFDGVMFVEMLFGIVASNWEKCVLPQERTPSLENWRWSPVTTLSPRNKSPEVSLERMLMRACGKIGRADWSNQVPVASGLTNPHSYKRKAIDLVHRRGAGAFDLIELKIGSDNPLYAAMEVLQYGLVWLLSRRDKARLGYSGRDIIEANDIRLIVLAPEAFFEQLDLRAIAAALDLGVAALAKRFGIKLGFGFQSLPFIDLKVLDDYPAARLAALLDARKDL